MKIKNILNSPWMILVLIFSLFIFGYIANIDVSGAFPLDTPNLKNGGIAYIWILGVHYALLVIMTVMYFSIFWIVVYGVYFLWLIVNKYRNNIDRKN
jgi:hypothetical protein